MNNQYHYDMTKQPTLAYLIPLFRGIRDENTHSWSLIDLFNTLNIPASHEHYHSFCVAGRINDARSGDANTVISVRDPSNTTIAEVTLNGKIVDGDIQLVGTFNGIRLKDEGRYHLKAFHNGVAMDDDKKFYFDVVKQQ